MTAKFLKQSGITLVIVVFSISILFHSDVYCADESEPLSSTTNLDPVVVLIGAKRMLFSEFIHHFRNLIGNSIDLASISDEHFDLLIDECLDNAVIDYILDEESAIRKVQVTQKEVMGELMEFSRNTQEGQFEQYLAERDLSYAEFKEIIIQKNKRKKVLQLLEKEIPTPAEKTLKKYHKDHKSEFQLKAEIVKFTQYEFDNAEDAEWGHEKYKRDEMLDYLDKEHKQIVTMGRWNLVSVTDIPKEFAQALASIEPEEISNVIELKKQEKEPDGTFVEKTKYYFIHFHFEFNNHRMCRRKS